MVQHVWAIWIRRARMPFNTREQHIISTTARVVRDEIARRVKAGEAIGKIEPWVLADAATQELNRQAAGDQTGDALMRAQGKVKTS